MTTTEGTAKPSAQGQEATKMDMDLSNGKHQTQYCSISTSSDHMSRDQTRRTSKEIMITP